MHDAAHVIDTVVVDVEDLDDAPAIAMPRVATEDLTMQVLIGDQWCRKMADAEETACELRFRLAEVRTRREQLTHSDGRLCPACFTPRELRRASENDAHAAEEAERRRMREDIDARFKALPRVKRPSQGDR